MADSYKILGQTVGASVSENTNTDQDSLVYEAPAEKQASISLVAIINTSSETLSYSLGAVKSDDTEAFLSQDYLSPEDETLTENTLQMKDKNILIPDAQIGSGEVHEISGGITLASGDQIRLRSNSDEIVAQVYGVEIE